MRGQIQSLKCVIATMLLAVTLADSFILWNCFAFADEPNMDTESLEAIILDDGTPADDIELIEQEPSSEDLGEDEPFAPLDMESSDNSCASTGVITLTDDAISVVDTTTEALTISKSQSKTEENSAVKTSSNEMNVVSPETTITSIKYSVHGESYGWQAEKTDGDVAGLPGMSKRLEALRISIGGNSKGGVFYSARLKGKGWTPYVKNGNICGTTGQSRQIEAVRIKLSGKLGRTYDVWYRAYIQHAGWTTWGANGKSVGTMGLSLQLEAIQVKLVEKGMDTPSDIDAGIHTCCIRKPSVSYAAYIQKHGWSKAVKNGKTAGTTGVSLRVEGIRMRLTGTSFTGGIKYRVRKQGTGWTKWSKLNQATKLFSNGKRVEAIQICLTGDVSKVCDVWYRSHVQSFGWMGWASNGKSSGTSNIKHRLEALQVKIVSKANSAPGSTWLPFSNVRRHPHLVLIGDSRTAAMYDALYGGDHFDLNTRDKSGTVWSARVGAGYSWMVSGGVSRVESKIDSSTAVVILLGVNDVLGGSAIWSRYISYINSKAAEWTRKGASVYYAAISPVGTKPGVDTVTDIYGTTSNKGNLASWNNAMKRGLSSKVGYLDTFHVISSNYRTTDGLHYDA